MSYRYRLYPGYKLRKVLPKMHYGNTILPQESRSLRLGFSVQRQRALLNQDADSTKKRTEQFSPLRNEKLRDFQRAWGVKKKLAFRLLHGHIRTATYLDRRRDFVSKIMMGIAEAKSMT